MKQTIESIMTSFQSSGKKHLILTGAKGSGKTTRFLEIARLLADTRKGYDCPLPGITTYAIPRTCVVLKENGTEKEKRIGSFHSEMIPEREGFTELGIPALNRAVEHDSEWVGIDELGFLENENLPFQEAVLQTFEKKRVLAVLRKQELPFLDNIKQRDDVFVLDLDEAKAKVGCVIMASGLSVRFGTNKLLQEFQGKTLFQNILDITSGEMFDKRVVVTRTKEVEELCLSQGIDVIYHNFPNRNDVVRLGTEYLKDMDALVFCPCDQPLLQRETLEKMLNVPSVHNDIMARLVYEGKQGAPILFGKQYFEELCHLPEKKGGSYLTKQYPQKVYLVNVNDERELQDIDTPEDMKRLQEMMRDLTRERQMTKNYIFDFGKVLVEFEPMYMTAQYIKEPADIKLVSEVVFDRVYWDKLDADTISEEEVKGAIRERLPERLWKEAEMVYDNWYRHLPEISGMRSILLRLKQKGHSLYLLSNISCRFVDNYKNVPSLQELFSVFDGLVFSAPIRMIKPEEEIFQYLLKKYNLKAEECTFIDDNELNVKGASKLGIKVIQFYGDSCELEQKIFLF